MLAAAEFLILRKRLYHLWRNLDKLFRKFGWPFFILRQNDHVGHAYPRARLEINFGDS